MKITLVFHPFLIKKQLQYQTEQLHVLFLLLFTNTCVAISPVKRENVLYAVKLYNIYITGYQLNMTQTIWCPD
jgi:hypothetical protein